MQIAILGRQPAISLAELESLFSSEKIEPISNYAAVINTTDVLPQSRLGGTLKSGTILTVLKNKSKEEAYEYINKNIVKLVDDQIPDGKIQLGISLYGYRAQKKWLLGHNLDLKKTLKRAGRSIRIIENKSEALETAQVLHNKLTSKQGFEFLIIKHGEDVVIAKATGIQDIDAYSRRDQGRPMRDAKVGMLPPKLAQIIINLTNPEPGSTILDPFCGTGVLLQESLLMGFNAFGTDIDQRMIDYTRQNIIEWLIPKWKITSWAGFEKGDATIMNWKNYPEYTFNTVAGETFLGKPLLSLPPRHVMDKIINECDQIHTKFLNNISKQIKPGTRLCLAVPAWSTRNGFLHLKTLDHLTDMGYTRMSFVHASNSELIYHRPGQTVARELVVLEKR